MEDRTNRLCAAILGCGTLDTRILSDMDKFRAFTAFRIDS